MGTRRRRRQPRRGKDRRLKQEAEEVDMVSNNSAAFPERSLAWRRQVALEWLCPAVSERKLALFPLGEDSGDSFFSDL